MIIRKSKPSDSDQIWDIFKSVIKTGDTYVFDPDTSRGDLEKYWFADHMETFVAEEEREILGTYLLKANHIGLGNHIANASYMIHPKAQRKGIGRQLGIHSLRHAKAFGYVGIQFNLVVSTNLPAIKLWKDLGFEIIGTTPNGFRHAQQGYVDTHIMYKSL